MKKLLNSIMIAAAFAAAATAQSTNAYVFVGPGGATGVANTQGTLQTGAGVELALPKGFGAGAEIGAISHFQSWGESTLGVFSPTGYYHILRNKDRKLDPFVDAGYTMFWRDGHENLFHFGGGVNYWATRHFGARVELRDQVDTTYSTIHYWGFRLAVAFR